MIDLKIVGGTLSENFVPGERFYRATTNPEAKTVGIIVTCLEDMTITVNSEIVQRGEIVDIALRECGFGYTTVDISVSDKNNSSEESFTLAILKPAPDKETLYSAKKRPQFHYTAPY